MAEIIRDPRLCSRQGDLGQRTAETLTLAYGLGITACERLIDDLKVMVSRPGLVTLQRMVLAHEAVLRDLRKQQPEPVSDLQGLLRIQQRLQKLIEFWSQLEDFKTALKKGRIGAS